jgi:CxxC motif-containing protein (DUF1111 family)
MSKFEWGAVDVGGAGRSIAAARRVLLAVLLLWCSGCVDDPVAPPTDQPSEKAIVSDEIILQQEVESALLGTLSADFGEPLRGLPAELVARFEVGKDEFEEEETSEEGLGPVFNDISCVACHDQGATGGSGELVETRFGRLRSDGSFDPMAEHGGSLIQAQGVKYADCEQPPDAVPPEATIVAGRQTTSLFGLGLLDAVPGQFLRALADPFDRNGDGISGRVNLVVSPATNRVEIGRFGWKAQVPSVFVFAGDAYLNEMGITSSLFPHEIVPQGGTVCDDGLPGDELEDEDADGNGISDNVEDFTAFMRFLAPPPVAGRASLPVLRGAVLFVTMQCANCHRPALPTGIVQDVPAMSRRVFYPFTDLLLHDMGSLGDGIEQGRATGAEMRTAPLWGLRAGAPYLHDGRAETISEAIQAHDGEGARARDRFERLSPGQRSDLLAFLGFI